MMPANSGPTPCTRISMAAGADEHCSADCASSASRAAFHRLDLLEKELESIDSPADLRLQMRGQGTTVARRPELPRAYGEPCSPDFGADAQL